MSNRTPIPSSRSRSAVETESEQAFLRHARQVWRDANQDKTPRRGHPLERGRLFPLIEHALNHLAPQQGYRWPETLSQSAVVRYLLERMEEGVLPRANEKTVKKYVRLYCLERSSFHKLSKGNRFTWLANQHSPVISEMTRTMRTTIHAMEDNFLILCWHVLARYALGPKFASLPARFVLDSNTLTGEELLQAVGKAVRELALLLLHQHPHRDRLENESLPHVAALIRSRRFQPLRMRRRPR